VLQVAKQQPANNLLHSSNSAANIQSIERLQRSVTPNSHQYQSAVAPLVPLHRVSQTAVPQVIITYKFAVKSAVVNVDFFLLAAPSIGGLSGLGGARPIATATARHTLPKL
jgi:hypothetical protein